MQSSRIIPYHGVMGDGSKCGALLSNYLCLLTWATVPSPKQMYKGSVLGRSLTVARGLVPRQTSTAGDKPPRYQSGVVQNFCKST